MVAMGRGGMRGVQEGLKGKASLGVRVSLEGGRPGIEEASNPSRPSPAHASGAAREVSGMPHSRRTTQQEAVPEVAQGGACGAGAVL